MMAPRQPVSELTVEELKTLIRQIVQDAVAEVMVEFVVAAEHDAQLVAQAELVDLLRNSPSDILLNASPVVGEWSHCDD